MQHRAPEDESQATSLSENLKSHVCNLLHWHFTLLTMLRTSLNVLKDDIFLNVQHVT